MVVHGRRTAIGRAKRGGFKVEAAGTGTGHRFGPERPATPADTSCVCPSVNCATFISFYASKLYFALGCGLYGLCQSKYKV